MINEKKLKQVEERFLEKYPGGFEHPDFVAAAKKHKMEQMIALSQESFDKSRFKKPQEVAEHMIKVVSRASMVSMFEKPKFRDFVRGLTDRETKTLTHGLKDLLYGNQQKGFDNIVDVLMTGKLAKWSLVTIIPNYVHPDAEVFIKPTTAKGVITLFEITEIQYKPTPTWDFYQKYRDIILDMRSKVDRSLAPNNAAFCGFLMMSM